VADLVAPQSQKTFTPKTTSTTTTTIPCCSTSHPVATLPAILRGDGAF
jgi:hypothetical protein